MNKLILTLIILAGAGIATWKLLPKQATVQTQAATANTPNSTPATAKATPEAEAVAFLQVDDELPALEPIGTFTPKDNTVVIEISEYAGYAGLILANNGLSPNPESYFTKKYGFNVQLNVSESESWSPLNNGRIAGATSTVDVLSIYGKQLQALVPIQLGYSRGADAIVVRSEINRINDLKGKILVTSQFTETDFFIRYLAQEAGLEVASISNVNERKANAVNLLFTEDGFGAGDAFLAVLDSNPNIVGCITWEPKVSEVVEKSAGKAKVLTSNKNLLIIADILLLNKGFAKQNPKMVEGLVDGILYGNNAIRNNPAAAYAVLKASFNWSEADSKDELSKVHFSNYPENMQFLTGDLDASNTFGAIFQASLYAYPTSLRHTTPWEQFVTTTALKSVAANYATQVASIKPIVSDKNATSSIENNPLLSKDIRFYFLSDSYKLADNVENEKFCANVASLLRLSPGSTLLLRGHVDNARVDEFRKQGGEALVRSMSIRAMQLSRQRSESVRDCLVKTHNVDPARIEIVGRGWEEPASTNSDENRRVEIYWFTLE